MAKRCACQQLLDVMDEARMRTLAPDVRMLWLDIARLMQRDGISVLRFGNAVVETKSLSRLVFRPETETETELESKITELCERGLLAREADGALACPVLAPSLSRSEINRINGSKGGRPRKDGAPTGQRTMLLPINGGAEVKPEKTKHETGHSETGDPTTLLIKKTVSEEVFRETGQKVLDAIGVDPARSMMNYGHVRQWLADGAEPKLILEVVTTIMGRPNPPNITSLRYFDDAIKCAIAAVPEKTPDDVKAWKEAVHDWEIMGRFGRQPLLADFRKGCAA